MTKEYRLIEIEENRDLNYNINILMVKLSEVTPSTFDSKQYTFNPLEVKLFIFINNIANKNFFIVHPKDVKKLNMQEFTEGTIEKTNGKAENAYKHFDYINAIIDNKRRNDLTIPEQFVKTLFSNDTIQKVKDQFASDKTIIPLDTINLNLRLFRPIENIINLETLIQSKLGAYFKPIGFFDIDMNIYLLREFQYAFKSLLEKNQISENITFKPLKIIDDAIVAAFSVNTLECALEAYSEINENDLSLTLSNYDKKINVNGLDAELIKSFNGTFQFFLNDKYKIEEGIAAYTKTKENGISINPSEEYKQKHDMLERIGLLTVYKFLK